MQLMIGSVQFGKKYGLRKKKISKNDLNKIHGICLENNINFIDTAKSYGDSEKLIGKTKLNELEIITKLKIPKNLNNSKISNYLKNYFKKTTNKLNVDKIYAILIHDINEINNLNKEIIINFFDNLKKKKLIKFFGASVYTPADVVGLLKFFKPDIIQFPLNIVDQRFLMNGLLKKLKKRKIKLAARSCFLQGFLLQELNDYPKFKLKRFFPKLKQINDWCVQSRVSRLDACIHFVKKNNMIDFMVVGFDDVTHLKKIIKSFKKKKINVSAKFETKNNDLIDPRRWKL